MLSVVPDRRKWLRHHPLDIVIVFLTPPVLPAGLQSLRALRLLAAPAPAAAGPALARGLLARGRALRAMLALSSPWSAAAPSSTPSSAEQHLDFWDDFYWAITTMTTLGSNIYPTTTGGEIVSTLSC